MADLVSSSLYCLYSVYSNSSSQTGSQQFSCTAHCIQCAVHSNWFIHFSSRQIQFTKARVTKPLRFLGVAPLQSLIAACWQASFPPESEACKKRELCVCVLLWMDWMKNEHHSRIYFLRIPKIFKVRLTNSIKNHFRTIFYKVTTKNGLQYRVKKHIKNPNNEGSPSV